MAFTFAAFCYLFALIAVAFCIFFAIFTVSFLFFDIEYISVMKLSVCIWGPSFLLGIGHR